MGEVVDLALWLGIEGRVVWDGVVGDGDKQDRQIARQRGGHRHTHESSRERWRGVVADERGVAGVGGRETSDLRESFQKE